MATRGRKPKPTALKALTGNPGKRPLPSGRATAADPVEPVEPPPFLDEYAREEWEHQIDGLLLSGVLTPRDRAVFTAYCMAWSRARKAHEGANQSPGIVKGANGGLKENPYHRVARLEMRECIRWAVELGMTPSARARVEALNAMRSPGDEDDPKERYFKPRVVK